MQIERAHFRVAHNYRLAILSERIRALLRAIAKFGNRSATPPETWRKGLLLGSDHIGDILYRTPSLPALAKAFPKCAWYMAASPPADQVLKNNPHISGVINRAASKFSDFAAIVRAYQFDVIICYGSPSLWADLGLGVFAGIPNRIAYGFKGFSGWITRPIEIKYPQPYPAYFRDMVAQLAGVEPEWDLRPLIYPDRSDQVEADRCWDGHAFGRNPVIACFVTTRQPSGTWSAEGFGRSLALIAGRAGFTVSLCGSGKDRPLLEQIKRRFNLKAEIVAGELGLRALYCFLKKTDVVLTPDSGPRHIANAAGVPVFFIRNPRSKRIETGSYLPSETDLAPPDENVSLGSVSDILAGLSSEEVSNSVISALHYGG